MNTVVSLALRHATQAIRSSPLAAEQTAANAAHAEQSRAGLSAAMGQAEPGAILTTKRALSSATAMARIADASVQSAKRLSVTV
jgi:hypothetical protein